MKAQPVRVGLSEYIRGLVGVQRFSLHLHPDILGLSHTHRALEGVPFTVLK